MKFPLYKQLDSMDCGPTCLRMIAHYGKSYSLQYLRTRSFITRLVYTGIRFPGILTFALRAANNMGEVAR